MEEPPPKRSLPSPRSTPQDQQTQQLHDNYWDEDASGPPSDTVAVKSDDHDAMNEEYGSAHKTPAEEVTDGTSNGILTVLKNAKASATTFVSSVTSLFPKLPSVGWSKLSGERAPTSTKHADQSQRTRSVLAITSINGIPPIMRLKTTVQDILALYSDPSETLLETPNGAAPEDVAEAANAAVDHARKMSLDDLVNDRIGIIIRKSLCGDLANLLRHRMYPSRVGGLFSNSLWTLVQSATPKPSPHSYSAFEIKAYRVVRDLETNECMDNDADRKFRTFVCAGLNHHFLGAWLLRLYTNTAVKYRFYEPDAFMVACPEHVFKQLLTVLDPLMPLPFRLFTSFEQRRRTMSRGKSMRKPTTSGADKPTAKSMTPRNPRAGNPGAAADTEPQEGISSPSASAVATSTSDTPASLEAVALE